MMTKTIRVSATVLALAFGTAALGACASLSEDDRNYIEAAKSDARNAADRSAQSAENAEAAARRAEAAAARAEDAAARAEAIFNRSLRK